MITYQDFNKFLDDNDINVGYAQEGDCIFTKMLEVMAYQNKKIKEIEDHLEGK